MDIMEIAQNSKIFKRFALGFLVVVLVATPFFSIVHSVFAQAQDDQDSINAAQTPAMPEEEYKAYLEKVTAESVNAPFVTDEQLVKDLSQPANKDINNPTVSAANAKPGDTGVRETSKFTMFVGNFVLNIAGSVTWLGGMALEKAIKDLVLGMGDMINNKGLGFVINQAWTTVRDICNLAFIFGFIYIGIKTIIDADSGSSKKFLASIIIGAVLINFSLFFTKVVIDVSNYLAVEIVHTMKGGTTSISAGFANIMGITPIMSGGGLNETMLAGVTSGGTVAFFVMGAIFLIVAGFVLAAGGILLIFRFVQLIFIMIFSPILFAGMVFPQTEKHARDLGHRLISQAFFAPVYLFLLLLSMKILDGVLKALNPTRSKDFAQMLAGQKDMFDVAIIFIIAIAFLIISLKAAQSMGAVGADKALAFGKDLRMRGQRALGTATAGLAAATGRNTVGRIASRMERSTGFQQWAGRSKIGEAAIKATRATAGASFDARNVAGVGEAIGIGKGSGEGGFNATHQRRNQARMAFAQSLNNDPGGVARTAYARRLANTIPAQHSVFGTMGRHDRTSALRILNTRRGEVRTELGQLRGEENTLRGLGRALTPAEVARLAAIAADQGRLQVEEAGLTAEMNHLAAAMPAGPGGVAATPADVLRRDY